MVCGSNAEHSSWYEVAPVAARAAREPSFVAFAYTQSLGSCCKKLANRMGHLVRATACNVCCAPQPMPLPKLFYTTAYPVPASHLAAAFFSVGPRAFPHYPVTLMSLVYTCAVAVIGVVVVVFRRESKTWFRLPLQHVARACVMVLRSAANAQHLPALHVQARPSFPPMPMPTMASQPLVLWSRLGRGADLASVVSRAW